VKKWVFDVDGTLVDSFHFYLNFLDQILPRPLTLDEQKLAVAQFPFQMIVDFVGEKKAKEIMKDLREQSAGGASGLKRFEHIFTFMKGLKNRGAQVALFTNRDRPSAEIIVETCSLSPWIDMLVTGDCVAERKPSPLGLEKIHRVWGGAASEYVMIGDHEHDMMAAKSFGALAVRASWHGHWQDTDCSHAHHQFFAQKDFCLWAEKTLSA
jgi:HAD superfamily hydrolase (TIGR01549 family)